MNKNEYNSVIPRAEYPRPQFVRPNWLCLNGEWQFEIDAGNSGIQRGLLERELKDRITVPFCPESSLSGIGNTDFMRAVWYRREITIPSNWKEQRVLLHFQAVDHDTTVWVRRGDECREVKRHRGGFSPFTCDLRGIAEAGDTISIIVRARDEADGPQARGKQSVRYEPYACFYTRTTGIWQSVWLEPVPPYALKRPRITPDVANGAFHIEQPLTNNYPGMELYVTLSDSQGVVCQASCRADLDLAPRVTLSIPTECQRLWSSHDPHLYDLLLELRDGNGAILDSASSYAGLRSIAIDGKKVKINGETIFQRLVLDQGYYPDGVMTAPSDAALENDILLAQRAGFNGARLHQKVFEERFLYHADRLGYLVWGEFADWGSNGYGPSHDQQQPGATYITQWLEVLERDYSHPCIIGWCPLNETHQPIHDGLGQLDDVMHGMFLATKAMDTTRPVLDSSGYAHRVADSDIYDSHDYIGEASFAEGAENMAARHARMEHDEVFVNYSELNNKPASIGYQGQPYFVSEFGGFKWKPEDPGAGWGYGSTPVTIEEFYMRFDTVCALLLDNPYMFGYCYTQLTDIYPEENGIYTFNRESKFDEERLRATQTRKAAIEI